MEGVLDTVEGSSGALDLLDGGSWRRGSGAGVESGSDEGEVVVTGECPLLAGFGVDSAVLGEALGLGAGDFVTDGGFSCRN